MKLLIAAMILVLAIAGGGVWVLYTGITVDEAKEAARSAMTLKKKALVSDLEKRAMAGDRAAQVQLAENYAAGDVLKQDYEKAAEWFYKAAKQGDAKSQFRIAEMYEQGRGVKQDNFRAAEWYKLAAGPGRNADAQFSLAQMYTTGRGVPNDYDQALTLYEASAERGHPGSQYMMGAMNEEGWGQRRDLVAAYKWYTLALDREAEVLAINRKYDVSGARKSLATKMNRAQIAEAEAAVEAWRKSH